MNINLYDKLTNNIWKMDKSDLKHIINGSFSAIEGRMISELALSDRLILSSLPREVVEFCRQEALETFFYEENYWGGN